MHAKAIQCLFLVGFAALSPAIGSAQKSEADLAKKLQNPVADLYTIPLRLDYDRGFGLNGDGERYVLDIQPVIPIKLTPQWNLISRTIVPIVNTHGVIGDASQSGLSDILQSFFFSPQAPTADGWLWGAGPVFLLPTATNDLLGTQKWGAGPTGVVLRQKDAWTYGLLANHVWSFAGSSSRESVNATLVQPFISYTTAQYTSYIFTSESTYNWVHRQWAVPLDFSVAQLVEIRRLPIQFELGYRYWADKPPGGPDWGLRFTVTFLFPR